ncbi:MAG TPA: type I phosphomannose isomerase catalytic subunit, partial [Segetibacter sp.]
MPYFDYFRLTLNYTNQVKQKIFKLQGKVQHYAWGGSVFIPQLLGVNNPEKKPFAEYWMGAHPSASGLLQIEG